MGEVLLLVCLPQVTPPLWTWVCPADKWGDAGFLVFFLPSVPCWTVRSQVQMCLGKECRGLEKSLETSGGAREAFCARPCFDLSAMPSDDENSLEWKALLFEELEAQRGSVTCPRGSVTGSLFFLRVGGQARLPRPLEVSDRAALVSVV